MVAGFDAAEMGDTTFVNVSTFGGPWDSRGSLSMHLHSVERMARGNSLRNDVLLE
jgi:hypothetical protein